MSPITSTSPKNLRGADSQLVHQEEQRQDLGFGTKLSEAYSRLINKDGSFNIKRVNEAFWDRLNVYNRLIMMRWASFLSWVILAYLVANLVFAGIYMLAGADNLKSSNDQAFNGDFWKAFFFSAQTLTTVGYGHIAPNSFLTSSIAAFESMLGLLAFALATGLLYGRFSRPTAHIRFSAKAVFAPYLDVNGWMFRVINARANQLIDVEVEVSLSRLETRPDGTKYRRYNSLNLERHKVAFFPTNWTLVHPITTESPLHGCTPEDLANSDAEFLILLRATDDTFSQTVHTRYSYRYDEVLWGRKFRAMFDGSQHGMVTLDLNKLDETDEVPLN
ncbi:potassium transporter [Spirosoma taeanense]|uniref:Potassium transporter n=1 Tax=Spirosoma taeanense TaxID=2735870 RepID=A0A6M5Y5U9_9BACT|nr:ion channel [Spirosoma taeanense]QJW88581.1 potassium transporter [Spirosoma taeanense]